MNRDEQNMHDPLQQLTEAVRGVPLIEMPPGLVESTVRAIESQRQQTESPFTIAKQRARKRLMRILTFSGFTAASVLAVIALTLFSASHSAAEDLKQALRKAELAKSSRVLIELETGEPAGKITTKNYMDQGKLRSEVEPAGLVIIINGSAPNKGIMKFTKMKQYRLLDVEKDELVKSVLNNTRRAMDGFKIPADDKVVGLANEYLDGRKTKVYEIKGVEISDPKGSVDLKIWIDPKTLLPLRSRVLSTLLGKSYTANASYLGFDEEMDPDLFDTSIPAGYQAMPEIKK